MNNTGGFGVARFSQSSHWTPKCERRLCSALRPSVRVVANGSFEPILWKNNVLQAQKVTVQT